MPDENATEPESKLDIVDGVQVYTRRDADGKPTKVDAINENEAAIHKIADRLQKCGFGVMRKRDPRAGKVYHLLKATWIGQGEPPDDPFKS